jgi:cyclopropane fatty-acyl-phospholipid synthase-like methyltransferase
MDKPVSPACERNRAPILEVLQEFITTDNKRLLEIGSGTGQHAVYFAPFFPHMDWIPSDKASQHLGMKAWFTEYKIPSIKAPLKFEVGKDEFPKLKFDVVFTANTFHIMQWKECKTLMKMLGHRLRENSKVFIYGPLNYNGQFTSISNEEFDKVLKERDPLSGIRSFEDVNKVMIKNGFELLDDREMPANNRMLIYNRLKFVKTHE